MAISNRFLLVGCVLLSFSATLCAQAQGSAAPSSQLSVAEAARQNQARHGAAVQVKPQDAQKLFESMDQILNFVSRDSGYAKLKPVARQLLTPEKLKQQTAKSLSAEDKQQTEERMQRSELVMKKFGLLPPNFSLGGYNLPASAGTVLAFYEPKEKTMYLFNWVPLEAQKRIMAHELTHALQDQNFDLTKFIASRDEKQNGEIAPTMELNATEDSDLLLARRAVAEGQARLVEGEYAMAQAKLPPDMDRLEAEEMAREMARNDLQSDDRPVYVHAAPRVLQESVAFPYHQGLSFELEILKKAGRKAAFAGMFARPPISTHEILQPAAYLSPKRLPVFTLPDLRPVLGTAFEPYDTGAMGEWDIQLMAEEFGRENDLYSVVPHWTGGGYIAVKKAGVKNPSTADVALVYVSKWNSEEAAKRFAQMYKAALPKRVKILNEQVLEPTDCEESKTCLSPLWAARLETSEGLVFVEAWPGNTVFITHSFEDKTVSRLRQFVLSPPKAAQMIPLKNELSMKLFDTPKFAALQQQFGEEVEKRMADMLSERQ